MQFHVSINQVKALAWGLNAQQAMLFAFLYQVPSWADSRQIDGHTFYNVGKGKIVSELPMLTDKPDTAYRLMKQLAKAGLIMMASCDNKTYMRLTPKGRTWNRVAESEKNPTLGEEGVGSEKFPTSEDNPPRIGKISEPGSEKSPTNQGTNDQDTSDQNPSLSDAGKSENESADPFDRFAALTDDGHPLGDPEGQSPFEPLPRKRPMTLDWEPDHEAWRMACMQRGLPADANVHDALIDFREHFAAQPGRTLTHADWTRRFARWVAENRSRHSGTTGGPDHASRQGSDAARDERRRIRESLANPNDTSWANGLWPGSEPGASTAGHGAGEPGVHSAGSPVPEDLGERVSERESAGPVPEGTGGRAGPLAGAPSTAGGREGDERTQAGGEYLAADDPGTGRETDAHPGGLRYASAR